MTDNRAAENSRAQFLRDAIEGLSRPDKALPGKYLWDEAGSALYDRICDSEDYYVARRETALIGETAGEIARTVGAGATIVEFGSGASRKVRLLLDAMTAVRRYVALDISEEYLAGAAHRIADDYPSLEVVPVCADYTRPLSLPHYAAEGPVLGFFPGSTIGNFSYSEIVDFLQRARAALGPSWFVVGADPNRCEATLLRAYGGADGLMAALHENLLWRMRRELAADVSPSDFRHEARVLDAPPRVEAHLVARQATSLTMEGYTFAFAAGESIRTDTSYKLKPDLFRTLAARAGWTPLRCWLDEEGMFSLHLLRARE